MKFSIASLSISGIKNIEKEITINFTDQTIKNIQKTNEKNGKILSIYGMNGAGKSAIINSLDLYLTIVRDDDLKASKDYLNKIINKKTNIFTIEVICIDHNALKLKKGKTIFKHKLQIKKIDDEYIIYSEELSKLSSKSSTLNGEYQKIIETNNGGLTYLTEKLRDDSNTIEKKIMNISKYSSIIDLLTDLFLEENELYDKELYDKKNSKYEDKINIILFSIFLYRINVYLEKSDQHTFYRVPNENIVKLFKKHNKNFNENDLNADLKSFFFSNNLDIVPFDREELYENSIIKLEKFIKIFNPKLRKIKLIKKQDEDNFRYSKIMQYDDYEVDVEFESTGIKKIIEIFELFEKVTIGEIVFIDELDANIHDVYLSKLLEFVANYAQGQLCFTSHNLSPMKQLSKYKNSIYFLNSLGNIVPWRKNGDYQPHIQYSNGMTENSPFNVFDFDFLEVFGE